MRTIEGTSGDDELFPNRDEASDLFGGDGDDDLFPGLFSTVIDGGDGTDTADFDWARDGIAIFNVGVTANLQDGGSRAFQDGALIIHTLSNIENLQGTTFDDRLTGDDGNNEFQGLAGDDTILGLGGDDLIFGGDGNDLVEGGAGEDRLFAGRGNDTLIGDEGLDHLYFSTGVGSIPHFSNGVAASLDDGAATAEVDGQTFRYQIQGIENLTGSASADVLSGDSGNNRLQGREGNDTIFGLSGDDTIFGGGGDDSVDGGAGADILFATAGNETLNGGADDDQLDFQSTLNGQPVFPLGVAANLQSGSAEAEILGEKFVYALSNFENLGGTSFDDQLTGDAGNNVFQGRAGDDVIFGLAGNDTLFGGEGDDSLFGGAGDDDLFATNGNAILDGGDGEDRAHFGTYQGGDPIFATPVTANLFEGIATIIEGNETFKYTLENIENIAGTDFDDFIVGDDGDNLLWGREGADTIKGGAGDDTIIGDFGDDLALYDGSSDHFTIRYDANEQEVYIVDRTDKEGTDTRGTNVLEFADRTFTVLRDGDTLFEDNPLSAEDYTALIELYIAYYNRAPDAEGLTFWAVSLMNDTTLDEAAAFFFDQPETRALYGDELDTPAFVNAVYQNVLGRGADGDGLGFWVDALTTGTVTEGQFIRDFLQGARAEPPQDASPAFTDQQNADRAYLDGKTDIGISFAAINGLSDVDEATAVMNLFDGSDASLLTARDTIEDFYADAVAVDGSGDFLVQLVGLVDDPFA